MTYLLLISMLSIASFFSIIIVLFKTRQRLKSVTEQTKLCEYKSIILFGVAINTCLPILSTIIALNCGVEWEWFGGMAMLCVFPALIVGIIPAVLVRKHMLKYKPKYKVWFTRCPWPSGNSHLINPKLDFVVRIFVFLLMYSCIYVFVSGFLPILLMYCGIDVNGIMLR
ncbi:MAG: hypothetical protein FWF56_01615 [Firmicutes bacterium]|nr:hypothetical protein [Bacillota bacterium]